MLVVAQVSLLLAVVVSGFDGVLRNELRTAAFDDAEVARLKLLKSPKKTLKSWHESDVAVVDKIEDVYSAWVELNGWWLFCVVGGLVDGLVGELVLILRRVYHAV